jgi:molybdenum cofactor cytidylyltransferase
MHWHRRAGRQAAFEIRIMPQESRFFSVVPAAGRSLRMGRPKLLLPWGATTVIEQVISAWQSSRVARIVVTVHPNDMALAEVCRNSGVDVVITHPPPVDMKASVLQGLDHLATVDHPTPGDVWLLAPADMPLLTADVIDRVLDAALAAPGEIVVPCRQGQRGHPVAFPWPLADAARRLSADQGLNQLLAEHSVRRIELGEQLSLADIDTLGDYLRLRDGPDKA